MDFPDVLATLNALPNTFTRPAAWYTQLADGMAAALATYTQSADAALDRVAAFDNAAGGWLDCWGLLFGFPRLAAEPDVVYAARIRNTLLAVVATVPGVQAWLDIYVTGATVIENTPGTGYVLSFPAAVTLARIRAFLQSFNRIRPVGVPFSLQQAGLGLYLGTEEYLGDGMVVGNYLTAAVTPVGLALAATTSSAAVLLPVTLLNDPTLNP